LPEGTCCRGEHPTLVRPSARCMVPAVPLSSLLPGPCPPDAPATLAHVARRTPEGHEAAAPGLAASQDSSILGPLAARPIETAGRTWCGTAWNRCCSPSVWGRTRLGTLVFSCSGRRCVPLWPRAWVLRESAGSAPGVLSTPCLAGRAFRWALR